ncbi:hypothetical protein CXB51_034132 [Gossypium anomalum]|uniref:Integrase catalytic domain-containing protein n=1 Tax=Gossypium anomalum TaxID=47600 RepID=A0A8J5YAK0_9ROSI|nr:hypothetical protein CXB51_034132 [Gossypium anomalum]
MSLYSCESLTVDEVCDSLTSYDKIKHFMVKPDSQGEGLIFRGRQDRNADDDRGRTQEWNPRGKSEGRSKSSNREDYSDGKLQVTFVNNFKVSKEWILDSGCTFHMSPNRDWFTTYKTVCEVVVLIGNNASCKIVGVGTIKVKTFDGVVRTLSEVRHVPELKRNLISLSTLDLKGFASSSLSDDDITKLWHMRLGYMSENGMVELRKKGLLDGWCKSEEIVRHLTVRHTPQQNGVVERMNKTIMEKTPQEVWSSNLANYLDLKIFGCLAYTHVDNGKLELRSIKCVFLGYKVGVKGYKLWCPENKKVVISGDIFFDETAMLPNLSLKDSSNKENQKQVEHQKNSDGCFVYLLLYVDDMLIAAKDKGEIRKVKSQLSEEFEMKNLGPVKKILGMEILRDRKAINVVSRYMANLIKEHWKAVQWILRYLRGTTDVCLQSGRIRDEVIGYVDADFTGDLDRRRSLTGYVFTVGGFAISWKATLQTTFALSTTKAEYMAIIETCKEAIWLKGLFSELNEGLQISTVFCDSQSAIFLTKDEFVSRLLDVCGVAKSALL